MIYIVYRYLNKISYACIAYEIKFEMIFILLYKNTQDINELFDTVNDQMEIYYNYQE